MKIAGHVLRRTWLYRLTGKLARISLAWLPRGLVYNRWNAWGRQRDLPPAPRHSFRALYAREKRDK
jgi:L-lactate dehydrogenase complex protein LldF